MPDSPAGWIEIDSMLFSKPLDSCVLFLGLLTGVLNIMVQCEYWLAFIKY
jgi:hypothetical protein